MCNMFSFERIKIFWIFIFMKKLIKLKGMKNMSEAFNVEEIFGQNVFTLKKMKDRKSVV